MNITMEEHSSLLTIMTILNKIKDRNLDDVFDNLQDIINLLKNYNVDLDDSIGIQVKIVLLAINPPPQLKIDHPIFICFE